MYLVYEFTGIQGSSPRSNSLMGRAWQWTHLCIDLKIHVKSFYSLHIIVRINLLMIGDLHCWVGLYSTHKKQNFDLYTKCFRESHLISFNFGFFPLLSKRLDLTEVPFSLKLMSSLMGDLFKWDDWYKKSSKGISVVLFHITYLVLWSCYTYFS